MIQIVCACRQLVEVVDRQVVEHAADGGERCPASGMTINVSVHARVGEFLGADEQLEGSGAAQAQKWAIVQIARALGDSFQEFEHMAVEVLDEQNRRVDG